jgi:2,4-dichlorophenol 6-monooxygenase
VTIAHKCSRDGDRPRLTGASGAAKRAALVKAMELKNYEFNAHGVEMGQFYESEEALQAAMAWLLRT